jgi:hypothetical protein
MCRDVPFPYMLALAAYNGPFSLLMAVVAVADWLGGVGAGARSAGQKARTYPEIVALAALAAASPLAAPATAYSCGLWPGGSRESSSQHMNFSAADTSRGE